MATENARRSLARAKNSVVSVIEFCGKHPFATGLFAILGVAGLLFSIYSEIQSSEDSGRLQKSVSRVESMMQSVCKSPPCWTAEQAIRSILGSTKDLVDSKVGVSTARGASGWKYSIQDCPVTVHYAQDVAAYFSYPLSASCPFSWVEMFDIEKPMPPPGAVSLGHMIDAITGSPELHMATGCINCGNWHEPYLEFRMPGPSASGFYDLYFTTDFEGTDGSDSVDNSDKFEQTLRANSSQDTSGTLQEFCAVDVKKSVAESLRVARVQSVGYGRRGWHGRPNYPLDICSEGYVAGSPRG